jgi:hypothetical protein
MDYQSDSESSHRSDLWGASSDSMVLRWELWMSRSSGSARDLIALAERLGQRWLKGIRLAVKLG